MGHRAIVAYKRPDGLFNLHYSHWGAADLRLKHDITAVTPLGGDENEPEFLTAFNKMLDEAVGEDGEIAGRAVEAGPETAVDPEPFATGIRMEEVVDEYICFVMHEAFYVVEGFEQAEPAPEDVEVHAFRTWHVPYCYESGGLEDNDPGLLVEPRWYNDDPISTDRDYGWYTGVRSMLDDMIEEETITEEEAFDRLIDKVLEYYHSDLEKRVLAHSPLLDESHWKTYPEAFVRMTGRKRVLGEMYPTGYREDSLEPWMLPDGFPLREPV